MRHFILLAALVIAAAGCATAPASKPAEETPAPAAQSAERLVAAQQALAADPQNPELHYELGNEYFDLGRYDEALRSFDSSVALDPQMAKAHTNRGLALRRLGKTREALIAYEQALAIEPEEATTLRNAVVAAQLEGDADRVAQYVDRLAAVAPDEPDTLRMLARTLYQQGRRLEAAQVFERLALRGAADAEDYYTLGLCHYDEAQWPAAEAAWEQALKLDPEHVPTLRGLPVVYWQQGDARKAKAAVERAQQKGIELDAQFLRELQAGGKP